MHRVTSEDSTLASLILKEVSGFLAVCFLEKCLITVFLEAYAVQIPQCLSVAEVLEREKKNEKDFPIQEYVSTFC